jgi:hypothetical protein
MSQHRLALPLLLLVAWIARFAAASLFPSIQSADEIFQVLEPAHRWVFGYGIETWEWLQGIRSPVPAALFVPVFWLSRELGLEPVTYLALIRAMLAALSLGVVWAAFRMGRTWQEGVVIAAPAALWCEMILFSSHALLDVFAANLLVPGLYLLQRDGRGPRLAAGALLAGVCLLRPALGPPVMLGAALALRWSWPAWRMVLLGGLAAALPYGFADMALGHAPFASTVRYILFNASPQADGFGTSLWNRYLLTIVHHWGSALPLLGLLIAVGARGQRVWLAVAAAILIEYSIIPHKEDRFIFPAIACLMIPLGVGLWRAIDGLPLRDFPKAAAMRVGVLLFAFCSTVAAVVPGLAQEWRRGEAGVETFAEIARSGTVCGVGLGRGMPVIFTGGYTVLHRNVPILQGLDRPADHARSVSDVLTAGPDPSLKRDFTLTGCREGLYFGMDDAPRAICHYRRAGSCAAP